MVFLVGRHCAGKSRVSLIFSRARFFCVDLGPTLREIHQRVCSRMSFADWIRVGEERKGRHFTDLLLSEEVSRRVSDASEKSWQDLLIVGSRSLEGVRYLAEKIGSYRGYRNMIVWVEAPIATLYRRYSVRNFDRPLSYQNFLKLLEDDNRLGLSGLKDVAGFELNNTGSEDELELHVQALLECLGYAQH